MENRGEGAIGVGRDWNGKTRVAARTENVTWHFLASSVAFSRVL